MSDKKCPICGDELIKKEIIYGMPGPEVLENRDKYILGGCVITVDESGNNTKPRYGFYCEKDDRVFVLKDSRLSAMENH